MKTSDEKKKDCLVFKPENYTAKELRECSLADLLFCDMMREIQKNLDPSKFRPSIEDKKKTKDSKLTPR